MFVLEKSCGKDFTVLNLTDPQLTDEEWQSGGNCRYLIHTVQELVHRVRPDLITVSGDLAWASEDAAYDHLANFLDSFGIPWAPVWGNHDNQNGDEYIDSVADRYLTHPLCLYEKGPRSLGNGNYVIAIKEDIQTVSAIIMMDSHNKVPYASSPSGRC